MTKIEVYGWGTSLRIIRVTAKQVKELLGKGTTEERLHAIEWNSKFSTGRSGFAVDGFELLVNGTKLNKMDLKGIVVKEWETETLDKRYSYLIIEETQKGCWISVSSRKRFKTELVLMEAEPLALPDGSTYLFMDMTFDGKGDFGWSEGKAVEAFIVTPAGEHYNVELIDEG
jgi:hypothetical protein